MYGDLHIKVGMAPSDAEITIDGNKINGVQKLEVIAEGGKPTKAMLYMSPTMTSINVPIWDVIGDTAMALAEKIATDLGLEHFRMEIYDSIITFKGKTSD